MRPHYRLHVKTWGHFGETMLVWWVEYKGRKTFQFFNSETAIRHAARLPR